ncbi:MAG TPA: glycine cleavage T C-terminal barrel domain-containing protein [Verrucomicrobiae bacterium]|nr:glycine cleavage T C-terminal barrel domain-containing protein [Verrucomicrobiae bacterium]
MEKSGITGIADLSRARARLRVTGADRVAFLQGQCTNDVKRLGTGQSCYAAYLTAKGKMRGEGAVVCLADAFLLEANIGLDPSLRKFIITEDVEIEDVSGIWGEWLVIGGAETALAPDATTFAHPLGTGVLSRQALIPTVNSESLEVLRIEAAVPKWGVDMDENTIPNEAGLEKRAISHNKGCYIGQETIARIRTYGHVNRQLVLLGIQTQAGTSVPLVPAPGEKIFSEEREVGHVTSGVYSEQLGKVVALGYVRREFARMGMKLKFNQRTVEVLRVCGA